MILDKKRNEVYRDLEDWLECNCPAEDCKSCPISSYKNGKGSLCGDFMRDFPERVLELLKDRIVEVQNEAEVKKEMEKMNKTGNMVEKETENQMETKETIPLLCRILGVRPYQEFYYEDDNSRIFGINDDGVRYEKSDGDWTVCYDEENLVKLIQHPEKVVPGEENQMFKDHLRQERMMEVLRKILPQAISFEQMLGTPHVLIQTSEGTNKLTEINLEALEGLM